MSAYVVDKITIDRVVSAAAGVVNSMHVIGARRWFPILAHHIIAGDHAKLGQALWRMNARNVAQRYSEAEDLQAITGYRWGDGTCRPQQAIKSLHCYIYQSCEGAIPETALYCEVESLKHYLQEAFVCASAEYEQAEWA